MGLVGALAQSVLDFLIDERCHACGAALADVPAGPVPPLATPVDVVALARFRLRSRVLCVNCAVRVQVWRHVVRLRSGLALHPAFVTDERLLIVVHLLKFGRRERIAPWLAGAMTAVLPAWPAAADTTRRIVVPVPMDPAARARRGFNQAESIARALTTWWRLPGEPRALAKVRTTRPQSALGRDERLLNLEGAFEADESRVRGAHVLLVDDLVTTGATAQACADALRRAGAHDVSVVCAGYHDDARPDPDPFLQS